MADPHDDIPSLHHALRTVQAEASSAYAEARYVVTQHQSLVRDALGPRLDTLLRRGTGVRVVLDGGEGFAAAPEGSRFVVEDLARRALQAARASAALPAGTPLAPTSAATGRHNLPAVAADEDTGHLDRSRNDPAPALDLAVHELLLADIEAAVRKTSAVCSSRVALHATQRESWLTSTAGASTAQGWRAVALELEATACGADRRDRVTRNDLIAAQGQGIELVERFDWFERARRLAEEAALLVEAPRLFPNRYPVVMAPDVMAALLHETIVVPLFDPALAASHTVGNTVGSAALDLRLEPDHEPGLASFAWDDLGRASAPLDLVRGGVIAARGDDPSQPLARVSDYDAQPRLAPTNVALAAGTLPLTGLLERGGPTTVYIENPRRWWLSPSRDAIVLECAMARFVSAEGQLGGYLREPVLEARTAELWQQLVAIGDTAQDRPGPVWNPAAPGLLGRVSLRTPPALFGELFLRAAV